jgi:hypothetical protein
MAAIGVEQVLARVQQAVERYRVLEAAAARGA